MAKRNTINFLEGAAAGLAIGVAATIFLSSKKGKELTKEMKDKLADFYVWIAPKVKKMEKMGEKQYKEFMKDAVIQYGKAKKLSENITKQLVTEAQKSWHHITKHS